MIKRLLTDPREHNPDDFVYLVHGFLGGFSRETLIDRINIIRTKGLFYRASLITHLDEKSAKERLGWPRGEVYQLGTFGNIGLILDPAYDSLVRVAWNCDLGSPTGQENLREFVRKHSGKIRHPLTLLTDTQGPSNIKYNELILEGDEKTAVKGVFYRPESEYKGKQLGDIVSELMQSEVPVIGLPDVPIKKTPHDNTLSELRLMYAHLEFYSGSDKTGFTGGSSLLSLPSGFDKTGFTGGDHSFVPLYIQRLFDRRSPPTEDDGAGC